MLSIGRTCEACRREPATQTVPEITEQATYHVCNVCRSRLETRSLRPREWYHLASIHGWTSYLLCDDFYTDIGVACQPEVEVVEPENWPFPSIDECLASIDTALDVAFVKWEFPMELAPLLAADKSRTLALLDQAVRERKSATIHAAALELAAVCLDRIAADWVRSLWAVDSPTLLYALARASSACLPASEALSRCEAAFRSLSPKELRDAIGALSWFQDEQALALIEEFAASPVTETWGRTAAACGISWTRAVGWLEKGRPLSLVALDALRFCLRYDTPMLRRIAPRLREPPELQAFEAALRSHLVRDPVHRVEVDVSFLLENADDLLRRNGPSHG